LSCLCFAGLALNNLLLFIDLVMTSQGIDLAILRGTVALVAVAILVFGLVMEDT
jgi:hypothetical protein